MGVGVDDAGCSTHALQSNGLPHQQKFVVHTRVNNDEVARSRPIDRALNRSSTGDVCGGFPVDVDGYCVNGLLAIVTAGDQQLTAARRRSSELSELLQTAQRHVSGDIDGDL